jgi:phosphoribosylamine--glycine ligase
MQARIFTEVVQPTVAGMREAGRPYRGILYVGLMLTADGPKVLEYNCRLGDPETQVILPRLDGDLLPLIQATIDHDLANHHPKWVHQAATCVVMAARGYPQKPIKGDVIEGLAEALAVEGVQVFHAATRRDGDRLVTSGGRVLSVVALAKSLATARERAYEAAGHIRFEGAQFRSDIGEDALAHLRGQG